ncbi:hypothetical protein DL96DRAFT_1621165, partial [Flagelloscypha sp. PMI_526]
DEDITTLTDAEILARFRNGSRLSPEDHPFTENGPRFITRNTIGKYSDDISRVSYPNEAFVLEVLRDHLTILVPNIRRLVPIEEQGRFLMVTDYIRGRQLSLIWPTMSDEEKAGIAKTLKGELEEWFNGRREIASWIPGTRDPRPPGDPVIPKFDSSYPLVLTHQDLNPLNMIVGDDGHHTLWIVDWGWSGFYPEWCELVAMKRQAQNEELVWERKDPSWDAIINEVCGEYPNPVEFLRLIGSRGALYCG